MDILNIASAIKKDVSQLNQKSGFIREEKRSEKGLYL